MNSPLIEIDGNLYSLQHLINAHSSLDDNLSESAIASNVVANLSAGRKERIKDGFMDAAETIAQKALELTAWILSGYIRERLSMAIIGHFGSQYAQQLGAARRTTKDYLLAAAQADATEAVQPLLQKYMASLAAYRYIQRQLANPEPLQLDQALITSCLQNRLDAVTNQLQSLLPSLESLSDDQQQRIDQGSVPSDQPTPAQPAGADHDGHPF